MKTGASQEAPVVCEDMEYTLIKSRRKTIAIEIREDGVIVRAPLRTSKREADAFVAKHADWIQKQRKKVDARRAERESVPRLTDEELAELKVRALDYIPGRVDHYARLMGLSYGRITLRMQKTRWGSCSAKKNLNFNILLMLAPPEVIDSVIVHELCHLREMNHSPRFYELVRSVYPEYDKWNRWLKQNGSLLMSRTRAS